MKKIDVRDYQWRAVSYIVGSIIDGEKQVAIVAPTGSGKSTIITSILLKLKSKSGIKGGIVCAPQQAIERGFYEDEDAEYCAPKDPLSVKNSVSNGLIGTSKNLYKLLRESENKIDDLKTILSGVSSSKEPKWALTTHQQMTHWGASLWPSNLSGLVLFIDEAHHAGETTRLFEVCSEWIKRGGQVIYVTATPYRADGNLIYPENTPSFIWTMSEHASSGFAPNDFLTKVVLVDAIASTMSEYTGDTVPDDSDLAEGVIRKMVRTWIDDGCPKAVFILPANNSIELSNKLEKLLKTKKINIVNVVGTDRTKQDALLSALHAERKVLNFSDSKVDAFIACKRFDEGTDWPLCSHVYNWGVPKSIGLILQRWGRACRSKDKYSEYPDKLKNTACITFFTLKAAKDSSLENKHFELSWLLATFMSDWKTGKKLENTIDFHFKNAINKIAKASFDSAENEDEYDSILKSEEELIQSVKDSDTTRITAKAELAKRELMLTLDGESPTIEAIESYNKTMNIGDDALELPMLEIMVEELTSQVPGAIDCLNSKISATISKFPDKIIKADLLDIFRSVLLEYKDKTISISEDIVSFQTAFTGQDSKEISSRLKELIEKPDIDIVLVKDIIQQYYSKYGKIPHLRLDGYIEFLPYKETWSCIDNALRYGSRGIVQKTSLGKLFIELGLKSEKQQLSIEIVKNAILEFHNEAKTCPTLNSGDATKYFGFEITWNAVNQRLTNKLGGIEEETSLGKLCIELGLKSEAQQISIEIVKNAILEFHNETKTCPTKRSGDATKYFGFEITWAAVNDRLNYKLGGIEEETSLGKLCIELGLKSETQQISIEIVKNAILEFHNETKTCPTTNSGEAEEYFGFQITWMAVDKRLRNKLCGIEEESSLGKLFIELGLKSEIQQISIEIVKNAILKFHDEKKSCPTTRSADATEYFGFEITWVAVDQRLRNKQCGIEEESSLGKLCIELRLKAEAQQLSIDIIKNAILKFHDTTKTCPTTNSGEAEEYFGFKTNWEVVNQRLRQKLCGIEEKSSISKLCIELGLKSGKQQLSIEIVKNAILKFHDTTKTCPTTNSGEAEEYFGFQITWPAVNARLMNKLCGIEEESSLSKLCIELGLKSKKQQLSNEIIIMANQSLSSLQQNMES
jgi:hypothetical protein